MTTLRIKNMVCDRCIMTVQEVLEHLDYEVTSVELGQAEIKETVGQNELANIDEQLQQKGFALAQQSNEALVEEIKTTLIDYLKQIEEQRDLKKLSVYLSNHLNRNYSYLSNQFSSATDTTIEQYFIRLKIERVKELLTYEELTLSEIAWRLNYSSVQYLSNQFKKITGMTVTEFKKSENTSRKSLDSV